MNSKKFKHSADDIMQSILEIPYIIEFVEGILPQEKFLFFKIQDILYLKEFFKGLFIIGDQEAQYREKFHEWAKEIDQELALLQFKFNTELINAEPSPSNLLYTSYLMSCLAENKFYKSLIAFYACHWVYYKVGKHLKKLSSKTNPYREWILFYSSENFLKIVKEYKSILYKTIEPLDENQINECIDCFRITCKMEYKFWDSAYNYEAWPMQEITPQHKRICTLTIAGSDSSGGSGIQADLNTFHSHKVVGCSVITAITAQNSVLVKSKLSITADMIQEQLQSVFTDFEIKAIKIGMIYEKEIIKTISNFLKPLKGLVKIVIDPVIISSSGYSLIKNEAFQMLCNELYPLSDLLTPNILEAVELLKFIPNNEIKTIENVETMINAAKKLCEYYNLQAILLKGGHCKIENKAIDVLFVSSEQKEEIFEKEFLDSKVTHGIGCLLSSAICANLAKGYKLSSAVKCGKNYVYNAVKKSYKGEY